MEDKVNKIIQEIIIEKEVTDEWFVKITNEISEILRSNCKEELKERLLMYSDHLFMCKNALDSEDNT